MTKGRTTLRGTHRPDRDRLKVEASNASLGSVFLDVEARGGCIHIDANRLRDAIDKAVGPDSRKPAPLTPDAITDEMVERGARVLADWDGAGGWGTPQWGGEIPESAYIHGARKALTAALTEPPARPEGAEEIEALLTEDLGDFRPPATPEAIADLLASRGVRVVDGERS